MTRRATLAAAAALLLFIGRPASAAEQTDPAAIPRMTIDEFKQAHAKGQVLPVDVRGHDSYRAGHVAGAVLAPSGDELTAKADAFKKSGKTVVTYCA